jgi:hypothetical protein
MSTRIPMGKFFTPIRRLQLLRGNDNTNDPFDFEEVELKSTITVEWFLDYGWDGEDFYSFASGAGDELPKIIWITKYAFLEVIDVLDFHSYGYIRVSVACSFHDDQRSEADADFESEDRYNPSIKRSVQRFLACDNDKKYCRIGSSQRQRPSALGSCPIAILAREPIAHVHDFHGVHFKEERKARSSRAVLQAK